MEFLGMKKKERAAGYPRVSDEHLKDSPTLESQEKAIREYCETCTYDLEDQHVYPEAMTAYMKPYHERPQFMKMIAAAKRREFDVLVVSEFSRLSRRQIEQAIIIDMLQKYGVRVESVTEKFDDSPVGIFMRNVFAFIAEVEREKTFWRTTRGIRDRCQDGKVLSGRGRAMYGYKWVDTKDYTRAHYELNLDVICIDATDEVWTEVKIVVFIYDRCIAGESIRGIAKTLTAMGIPTRNGKSYWQAGTVGQILENEAYTGKATAFRWKRDAKKGKNGYSVIRPEEEQIVLPDGIIPRIIDPDIFQAVQEKVDRNKEEAARNNKWPKDVLLRSGLVRCSICGAVLRVKNVHGSRKTNLRLNRYVCEGKPGVAKHTVNIGAKTLDEATWAFAVKYILHPDLVRKRVAELRGQAQVQIDREAIEKIVAGIKKKMKNLYALAQDATDDDTIDSLKALLHDLERQKREAEAMLYEAEEEEEKMQELNKALDTFETWAQKTREVLTDPTYVPTYEEKRLACKILGIRVTVWPMNGEKRYDITLAPPSIVSLLCG